MKAKLNTDVNSSSRYTYSELTQSQDQALDSNRGLYLQESIEYPNGNYSHTASASQDAIAERGAAYLHNGTCGVDKTRISVRIQPETVHIKSFMDNLLKHPKGGDSVDGIAKIPNFPEIFVKWDYLNCRLILEFNPSAFTRPEGLELCPFSGLAPVTELVIRKVFFHGDPWALPHNAEFNKDGTHEFTLPKDWEADIEVFSIDLARDFHVSDSRFSLNQLGTVWPQRSRNMAATHFLNAGRLNTLSYPVSKRTTRIKLYDKYRERQVNPVESLLPIKKGTFRFEIHIPRHQLKMNHSTTLNLLTESRLEKMLKLKWEISNYWSNLTWEGAQIEMAHSHPMPIERINEVIGFIEAERLGITMKYTDKQLKAIKTDAKRIGLVMGRSILAQGEAYGHLHFSSGGLSGPIPNGFNRTDEDLFSIIRTEPLPRKV